MPILPQRSIFAVNVDNTKAFPAARGGILTAGSFSGLILAEYHGDPSGLPAVGILLNDVENMYLDREYDAGGWGRGLREVTQPMNLVQALTKGSVITDFIDPNSVNEIKQGASAYVGPSGLISALNIYGSDRIGYFESTVGSPILGLPAHDTGTVLFRGGGLIYSKWQNGAEFTFNEERVYAVTPGWAKVRITLPGGAL